MVISLELSPLDSFWDFESWINWLYEDFVHWFLLPRPLELTLFLSSFKLGTLTSSCLSIKILFCKKLPRFGVVYNQRKLSATSTQSFPVDFFIFHLLQETIWSITVVLNIPLESELTVILRDLLYYFILHCEVYLFSPKCSWQIWTPCHLW